MTFEYTLLKDFHDSYLFLETMSLLLEGRDSKGRAGFVGASNYMAFMSQNQTSRPVSQLVFVYMALQKVIRGSISLSSRENIILR